jgi:cyclophilin family peptidyl-prolyl cis-trans isomerase
VYLEDTHGENIRYAYRHLPLISIHDKAVVTAEATEAAAAQGKFWEMHDLLFERQQAWNPLSEDELRSRLVEYAEELELDTKRFKQDLEEEVYREKILADYEAYAEYGPLATPTYVVNNVFYPTRELGLNPYLVDAFVRLVQLKPDQYREAPPVVVDSEKDYVATIRTTKGDIVAELLPEHAPANVNSFAFLAQEGWFDGLSFFYVEPGVVAQSGDPTGLGAGMAYPGYTCGDELDAEVTFDEAGILAMFTAAPGRNSSQFFITYEPLPELNDRYTIIGRVIDGMDVAESLVATQPGPDQPEPDLIKTVLIDER